MEAATPSPAPAEPSREPGLFSASLPPMPRLPITSEATLERCAALDAREDDLFICSFPKSGTTWTQAIVHELLRREHSIGVAKGEVDAEEPVEHISDFAPFFEVDRTWADGEPQHRQYGVRAFNTHLRWDMMPKHPGCRYIYLYRNGEDVCASFFHHLSNQEEEDGGIPDDFEAFLAAFLAGETPFGKWAHHLQSWMPQRDASDSQILFVRYEDLVADLEGQLLRFIAFLNLPQLRTELGAHRAELLDKLCFGGMQAQASFYQPRSVRWKNNFRFLRKGVKGDAKNLLSAAQFKRFHDQVEEDFGGALPPWMEELLSCT